MYTEEQYQAINDAIAQGALKVKYADKEVEYRSLDEMIRIRNLMAAELGIIKRNTTRLYAHFDKGFNNTNQDTWNTD